MHYHSRRSTLNNLSQLKSLQSSSTILNRSKYTYPEYDQSLISNQNSNIINNKQNDVISNNSHKQLIYQYSRNKEPVCLSQSPLKRTSDLYDINIIENSVRRGQEYSYNHTRKGSELNSSGVTTSRGQDHLYKPTIRNSSGRKSFRTREPSSQFQNLPQRDTYETNRIPEKRQQRYSYINEKQTELSQGATQINEIQATINSGQQVYKRKSINTQRYNSRRKQETYKKSERMSQQEAIESRSAVLTPQKSRLSVNTNPYIQKSQMLRQRMEKLEKMTPRGSIYKKLDEEQVKRQTQQDYSPRLSMSKTNSTHNSQISSAVGISQTKITDYDPDFRSKQLCDYYDQQKKPRGSETFRRNSVGDIQQLSNKINNRLKAIINKHQK